jgi:hypothetical protein
MRHAIPGGLLLLALGLAVGSPLAVRSAEPRPEVVIKWEYRILTKEQVLELGKKDLTAGLNALGDEGWELVAAEPSYIFKRPRGLAPKHAEEVKRLVLQARSDVEMWKDRVNWAERMVKKGYLTERQLQADQAGLQTAEAALQALEKELKTLPPEKESKPEK